MYLILTLVISSGFCIQVEKECEDKWDVDYFSDSLHVKHLVTVDMTDEDDAENYNCFYRRISERRIPTVTLFDKNKADEKINRAEMNAVKKSYLYRTISIAFVVILPRPIESHISQCKYIDVLRRYPKALITFIFYKSEDLLSKSPVEFEGVIYFFVNYMLVHLKFMKVVGIVLNSNVPRYFTYDVDQFYTCGVRFSRNNFDHNMLVQQSRKLIENYPVRISMFHRPPTCIQLNRFRWKHYQTRLVLQLLGNKVVGIDGLQMADIIKYFKFKPVYVDTPGVEPFGVYLMNGSSNGVLGDIINKNTEISSNSRFITSYGADDKYYFLAYNHFDRLCVMVPSKGKLPVWVQVLKIYSSLIWTMLNVVAVLLSVLRWIHFNLLKKRRKSLFNIFLETYFSVIVPISHFRHSPHRMLLAINLIISIIFVPIFQGNIRSAYTKRKLYPSVDTLESLDEHFSKILLPSIDRDLVFSRGINELYDRLDRKIEPINDDFLNYIKSIHSRQASAVLVAQRDAQVMLNFIPGATSRVSLVKECPREYLYAFICSSDFPWAEEVELAIYRLLAAGIPSWYNRMTEFTVRLITASQVSDSAPEYQALNMYIMSGPFYVFAVGIILCTLVFLVEIVY